MDNITKAIVSTAALGTAAALIPVGIGVVVYQASGSLPGAVGVSAAIYAFTMYKSTQMPRAI